MGPELQPDVPLIEVALYALFNPATIVVAFLLGREASEKNKLMIASFGGAVAGFVLLYIATWLRIWEAPTVGRAAAGVFAVSLISGLLYARIGYAFKR